MPFRKSHLVAVSNIDQREQVLLFVAKVGRVALHVQMPIVKWGTTPQYDGVDPSLSCMS